MKKTVGDLQKNSNAVTDFAACIFPGPVTEMFHDIQCIIDCRMCTSAVNIHNSADTAGIMIHCLCIFLRHRPPPLHI